MEKTLLNPWALNAANKIISIEHAHKGEEYRCPVCHQPMSYCKKGDGPHARIDHFKHRVHTDCHGAGESEIHKMAKVGIYQILRNAIEKRQDIPFCWKCPECDMDFKGDLLKRAKTVEMEKDLNEARPDIAILDDKGTVFVAIEIVFTHDVESKTLKFFEDYNIVLIRVVIHSAEDCNDLLFKLKYPDSVNLCFNKWCENSHKMQVFRKIVGLKNKDGNIVALTVALDNPFEDEPIWGIPFTETDKKKAMDIAKRLWPNRQFTLGEKEDIHFLAPVSQDAATYRPQIMLRPTYNQTNIDKIMHQRQLMAIRRNYAIRNARKSGGGRRRR